MIAQMTQPFLCFSLCQVTQVQEIGCCAETPGNGHRMVRNLGKWNVEESLTLAQQNVSEIICQPGHCIYFRPAIYHDATAS